MRPIRTTESNFTYLGFKPEIGDMPVERDGAGRVFAVYALSDEERIMIANGAHIRLGVHQEPIPPISMSVQRFDEEPCVVEGRKDFRCDGCNGLYVEPRAHELGYVCGWCEGSLASTAVEA
jgi:hypothetical protein